MSKSLIAIIIIILVIAGGAFTYLAMNNDEEPSSSQENSSEQASNDETAAPTFTPENTVEASYLATISGTSDGDDINGTLESDGDGSLRFNITTNGETSELIITNEGTFSCTSSEGCFRFSTNDGESTSLQSAFNPERFTYDEEAFQELQELASYQGQQVCNVGRCDVWVYSDGGSDATIFIDPSSNRVARIESTEDTSTFVIEYDYQDVTITAPEDYEEIPNIQGNL
jgi:hypothetical protein